MLANLSQKFNIIIIIIIMIATLGQITTDIYLPSIPSMAVEFNVPVNYVQLSLPLFTIGFIIGALFYGPISDCYGRKPLLIFSLCFGLLGSILCSVAPNIHILLCGRFIQGLGLSGTGSLSRAITRDIAHDLVKMAKLGSVINILYASATAIAPLIGGYIEKYLFWRINFILICSYILLLLFFIYKFFAETNQYKLTISKANIITNFILVFKSKDFICYGFVAALGLGGLICFQTVSSSLLQIKLGLTPEQYGYSCLLSTLFLVIGGYLNNKLISIYPLNSITNLGLFCYFICGISYGVLYCCNIINTLAIIVPFLFFLIGCSIILPNCSACAMNKFKTTAGVASAAYAFLQMIGATFGSTIISLATTPTLLHLGIFFTSIAILSYLSLSLLKAKGHQH